MLKKGKVMRDGAKTDIITGANLSDLFDIPVETIQVNGFFQAMPGIK